MDETDIRLSSGCEPLDNILDGGFENGIITQIYGDAGSGKTNLCIQLTVQCVKNGRNVVFIDTESLSPKRFKQIAGDDYKKIAKNVMMYDVFNFDEQYTAIKDIQKLTDENIGLVVVDSATSLYRFELDSDDSDIQRRRELSNQVGYLHVLARKYQFPVVITNQVYTNTTSGEMMSLGGNIVKHLSKAIVQFENIGNNKRRATIRKHRSEEEGKCCEFMIDNKGLVSSTSLNN